MRRWFVLALAPSMMLAAHALVMLSAGMTSGPSFVIDPGLLLFLALFAVEVISLAWLGGSLLGRWPAARHEWWTLPIGVALGLLPWTLLAATTSGAAMTMTALAGWTVAAVGLGALVPAVRSRRAARRIAAAGGAALVLLIPFLVARAYYGGDLVPWWSAPLWAPAAIVGTALLPIGVGATYEASLVTVMILFGSALYLATVATRAPSTVDKIPG